MLFGKLNILPLISRSDNCQDQCTDWYWKLPVS